MHLTLRGARLVDATGERPGASLVIDGARIAAVGPIMMGRVVDAGGAIITPGFVDVHTHGGGGASLHTDDPDEIRSYARWAPRTGTTAFLAGVVGVPGGLPEAQLRAAARTPRPGCASPTRPRPSGCLRWREAPSGWSRSRRNCPAPTR
jgi:N-acetylglucosamine-6-phosphate deacetylase